MLGKGKKTTKTSQGAHAQRNACAEWPLGVLEWSLTTTASSYNLGGQIIAESARWGERGQPFFSTQA